MEYNSISMFFFTILLLNIHVRTLDKRINILHHATTINLKELYY